MKEITINLSYAALKDDILNMLEYIASKRADDKEFYYRCHACGADAAMIRRLIEEALAWFRVELGKWCRELDIVADNIGIVIETRDGFFRDSDTITLITGSLFREKVICEWFRIIGITYDEDSKARLNETLVRLKASLGAFMTSSRRVPPL